MIKMHIEIKILSISETFNPTCLSLIKVALPTSNMRLYSFVFTKIDGPYLLTCSLGFPEPKIVTFIISAQSDVER